MIVRAYRDVKKLDPSYIVVGMKTGAVVLKNSLAIPQKVQPSYRRTQLLHSKVCIPKTSENVCPHRKRHTHFASSIIRDGQNMET